MESVILNLSLVLLVLSCGVSSESILDNSNYKVSSDLIGESISKKSGEYEYYEPSYNPYHAPEENIGDQYGSSVIPPRVSSLTQSFSNLLERQDTLLPVELAAGLTIGAAVGAAAALVWSYDLSNRISDVEKLSNRISEEQTSICTSVKAVTTADSGKEISGGFSGGTLFEEGYLAALAAVATPTCG